MTIASELAAQRSDVKGPGSFIPALIDELASLTPEILEKRAKIECKGL
jgi:thiamine-phosphate diphosphorylase/hydroxyethylthiazole kinase